MIRAVFFDVDFTLIYPGPTFQGQGYERFCADHGIVVDPERFGSAVQAAAAILDGPDETLYSADLYVTYTRRIIEGMGGRGPELERCAMAIYEQWAANHHFELYGDTVAALETLAASGTRVGLISNSHRCLTSFQEHFALTGLFAGAVSSLNHGMMKPHASIFNAAMRLLDVGPRESVMVGDSLRQDVRGALNAGMRAVLLHRQDEEHPEAAQLTAEGVPIIRSLDGLTATLRSLT